MKKHHFFTLWGEEGRGSLLVFENLKKGYTLLHALWVIALYKGNP
jgi:hypothetical protein